MIKAYLGRLARQARTLWQVATGSAAGRSNEALDLFLTSGHSVQKISALLLPGIGGPELVRRQMDIQATIRAYVLEQEKTVLELREEVQQLRLQALKPSAENASAPAMLAEPASLLGELLGIGGGAA